MKYEKELYIQTNQCVIDKIKRKTALRTANDSFKNMGAPDEKTQEFNTKNKKLIEDMYVKEKKKEFMEQLEEIIRGYNVPVFNGYADIQDATIFRVKIEIEPIFVYKNEKERKRRNSED